MVLVNEFSQKDDDELREYCNQAYEAFIQRCPEAITPHIKSVSSVNTFGSMVTLKY